MPRLKTCKNCRERYQPSPGSAGFVAWCSPECGAELALERYKRKAEKAQKAADRDARERFKTLSDHTKAAQKEFNAFIRARDYGLPCISCGKMADLQCGHHRSVAAAPELRFNAKNANGQCMACNQGSAKYQKNQGVVSERYTYGAIARFGADRISWLYSPHKPMQYRAQDLKRIAVIFRRRAKHYKKLRGI